MSLSVARAGRKGSRPLVLIAAVMAATFTVSFTSFASSAHAAAPSSSSLAIAAARAQAFKAANSGAATANTTTARAPKKAVIVVGPVGADTSKYITYAKAIGKALAASPDISVTYVLPPNATWAAVAAAGNGADFFAFLGHGNGWPSPMPPAQEEGKDGMGLNPTAGDTNTYHVKYYGSNYMIGGKRCTTGIPVPSTKELCQAAGGSWKDYGAGIKLAPNALVLLNHACYSSGNASPGMALPNQDVAYQRVDNFAQGFLGMGAKAVFALGWQPGEDLATALITKHMTMDGFFKWTDGEGSDPKYQPWHGWVGWKPNIYLDSARVAGAVVHLDPHPTEGYLRAVTGDLGFTFDEWWDGGTASDDTTPPTVTELSAGPVAGTTPAGTDLPVFTPNGDAITDTLAIKHTLSEPAYLDVSIAKADTTVVRTFTAYSEEGATSDVWDGRNNAGSIVGDGAYTITVTPKDRAGNIGEAATTETLVLTAMRAPKAAPAVFYAADADLLAQTQTQSVTLDQPAALSWVIRNKTDVVRTVMTDELHDVGPVSFVWDGLDDSGASVPDGIYTMVLTAVTDKGTYSHSVTIRVMPFKVTGTWKGTAGTTIKLTIVTAEPQNGWPTFYVKQPGLSKYRVSLIKYSTTKFTATFTVKAGAPGTAKITITGTDTGGGVDVRNFNFTVL